MAKKKKRAAPEKKCGKCGEGYHPRIKNCPHCGAVNHAMNRKKKVAKKAAIHTTKGGTSRILVAAADFIEAAGGIDKATEVLAQLRRIAR